MHDTTIPAADRVVARSDNQPPPREQFKGRVAELVRAVNAWAHGRRIRSEEEASKCEDLIGQLRKEREAVEQQRKAEKKPFDDGAKEVQLAFLPLIDTLDAAAGVLNPLKAAWLRLKQLEIEEATRQAEEAARKAQEEAEAAAKAAADQSAGNAVERTLAAQQAAEAVAEAQAAAERAQRARPHVVGEVGGRASGFRTVWAAEITDWSAAASYYSSHARLREVVQALANADARATKKLMKVPGCRPISKQEV